MSIHQLSPLDAVASLKSAAEGLGHAEVERRLQEFGRNAVEEVARTPLWLRLIREFITFFSLILWVAAGLAFVAEWSDPGQGMAKVGYAIVTVILVSGLFSFGKSIASSERLRRCANCCRNRSVYCARARPPWCRPSNWCRGILFTFSKVITSPRTAG